MLHCVEEASRFLLLVEWERLGDHLEGLRGSPAFASWRALVGPFFACSPVVVHFADSALASPGR